MQKVISAVVTFVIGFLIYQGFLYHAHGLGAGKASDYFTEPSSVPLILLLALQPVHLFGLWLMLVFLRHVPADRVAFPRFWVEDLEAPSLGRLWEVLSAAFALFLPLVGFAYFWVRFHRNQAWTKEGLCQVSLWWGRPVGAPCDPSDGFRYGDLSLAKRAAELALLPAADRPPEPIWNGVDYLPVLEPLTATALSLAALAMTVLVTRRWVRRMRPA